MDPGLLQEGDGHLRIRTASQLAQPLGNALHRKLQALQQQERGVVANPPAGLMALDDEAVTAYLLRRKGLFLTAHFEDHAFRPRPRLLQTFAPSHRIDV